MPQSIARSPAKPPGGSLPAPASIGNIDIYQAFLSDARCPNTELARRYDLESFALYLGLAGPAEAARLLCSGTAGQANAVALGFKRHLMDAGRSSGTINRRLCTLRKLAALARRLGLVAWALDVEGLPWVAYRDTAGPGRDGWRKVLAAATAAAGTGSAKGARDLAIIRLLHDNGLRCCELVGLDLADLDLDGRRVSITGKGRMATQWVTINRPTAEALAAWLAIRGADPGPVFPRLSRPDAAGRWRGKAAGTSGPGRIVTRAVYRIVRDLGEAAGLEKGCRPHGLRHAGTTRLLDLTNGDVRAVQKWTRHKNVNTVLIYDDNRRDVAGELAGRLGDDD